MHPQLLCSTLEAIVNQALAMSLHQPTLYQKLEGKSLCILLSEIGMPIQLHFTESRILISSLSEMNADCSVYTSFATLNDIRTEHQLTDLIKQDKLNIDGDIKVAQQFAALAEHIDIDWAAQLERHLGDIATHKLLNLGKNISTKIGFVKQQITSDASEYLIHEQKLVVTQPELARFNQSVSLCQQALSSLEQRIKLLEQQPLTPSSH